MSTGMGGTNAHLVIEEAPARPTPVESDRPNLLVWSARTGTAIDAMAVHLHEFLQANPAVNLGDAAYRAGDDAAALVAWVRAARLSPRDGGVRRALLLVAPADAGAASSLWVSPFAPAELWLVGLIVWLTGWGAIIASRRFRGRWA